MKKFLCVVNAFITKMLFIVKHCYRGFYLMLMHMHFITIVAFLIIENCYKYVKFKRHIKLFVTMVLFYNYKLLKIGKVFDLAKFLMLIC